MENGKNYNSPHKYLCVLQQSLKLCDGFLL
jgi:hypothetical protein